MSKRQITIKPTCMRDILAFPADRTGLLFEKINQLVTDPLPDGNQKKKLHKGEGIYRLRIGDHRIFYRFTEDWVSLLSIRRRREDTYRAMPETGESQSLPPPEDEDLDVILDDRPKTFSFGNYQVERPLPVVLETDWLNELGIPQRYHPALQRCKTEEDLIEAQVSNEVLSRVLDAIFPPALDKLVQQPDLLVPSTDHLVRYKEGNLLDFLLKLDDDQIKLSRWALKGPTLVKGGAGTGKSTVALYRVREVLERPDSTGKEQVLFTTYTRALIKVTRQLLEQILTPEQHSRVRVSTCDQVAREVVAGRRQIGSFEKNHETLNRLQNMRKTYVFKAKTMFEARLRTRAVERLSDQYLLEEFDWILSGRNIRSLEEYLETTRTGRGIAFNTRMRTAVWELYHEFIATGTDERFPDLRNEALEIVKGNLWKNRWDYVFVDEAQDLSPTALAFLAEICAKPEGLFFVADSKQSIYSHSYRWVSTHPRLQFRGRTAFLKRNYRSTKEIEQAAFSVLEPEEGETIEPSSSIHDGPPPVMVRGVPSEKEAEWICLFVREMSFYLRLQQSAAAVLVPTSEIGKALATQLSNAGVPASFFAGSELDLKADCVKILTLHSAKGLEFPIVAIGGLYEGTYPEEKNFDDIDLFAERMRHERRLLYVAMTRAMRGLMLLLPDDCKHKALNEIDVSRWYVKEAE